MTKSCSAVLTTPHPKSLCPFAKDETSLEKLNGWGMEGFKVASADFTNHTLISQLARTETLICSTGMASELEIRSGIRHAASGGGMYFCTATPRIPRHSRT